MITGTRGENDVNAARGEFVVIVDAPVAGAGTSGVTLDARRLLDELSSDVTANADTRAAEAVAHSILVLAEQVAAARLIMAAEAANGVAAQH